MRLASGKNTIKMPRGVYEVISVDMVLHRGSKYTKPLNIQLHQISPGSEQFNMNCFYTSFSAENLTLHIFPVPNKQTDYIIRYTRTEMI